MILQDDKIPLTSIHFRNGLWDNTWAIEPENDTDPDKEDEDSDNPLQLNAKQCTIYDLATLVANCRVTEHEKFSTEIQTRYPPMTQEFMLRRQHT